VVMGALRLGKLIQFVPHPVTTGFTAGIATVIAFLQIKDLFGLRLAQPPDHFIERLVAMWRVRGTFSPMELGIGALTLALLLVIPRLTKKVPAPLLALPVAAVVALLAHRLWPGFEVATIGSRFQTVVDGVTVAGIPQRPPMLLLPWTLLGPEATSLRGLLSMVRELLPSALAIALLGAIESLLSAVVADGMGHSKHDPDAELFALGIGNLLCPFFGGIPCTGAIARTGTAVRYGARSPIACVVHALTILAAVLALAPALSFLPMASLAALLVLVAWNLSERKHFAHMLAVAPKSDVAVLLICFFLTVVFDMVVAVIAGIVLAAFLFMRRMADVFQVEMVGEEHPHLRIQLPRDVVLYEVNGPLFFGAAEKAMESFRRGLGTPRVVILYVGAVPAMDVTGLVALENAFLDLEQQKVMPILAGLRPQPRQLIEKSGFTDRLKSVRIVANIEDAIDVARAHSRDPREIPTPIPA
jgi:sulfate permease, SulP family